MTERILKRHLRDLYVTSNDQSCEELLDELFNIEYFNDSDPRVSQRRIEETFIECLEDPRLNVVAKHNILCAMSDFEVQWTLPESRRLLKNLSHHPVEKIRGAIPFQRYSQGTDSH